MADPATTESPYSKTPAAKPTNDNNFCSQSLQTLRATNHRHYSNASNLCIYSNHFIDNLQLNCCVDWFSTHLLFKPCLWKGQSIINKCVLKGEGLKQTQVDPGGRSKGQYQIKDYCQLCKAGSEQNRSLLSLRPH